MIDKVNNFVVKYVSNPKYLWYYLSRIMKVRLIKMRREKYQAIDIANWFLYYTKLQQEEQLQDDYDVYEGITHLKLQKLLYFAEGICLAVTDKSLFQDKIYAWPHGPVVKTVYDELFYYGKAEIEFNERNFEIIKKINKDPEIFNILKITYDNYAGYTAWQLREKTHVAGGPWQVTVSKKGMQKEIDKKLIKEYFKDNIVKVNE